MATTTAYSDIEAIVAQQVAESLRSTLNLYFGTDNTLGEVRTRDIGLYEKKTFKILLDFFVERLIYERDKWLGDWGRTHLSETEFKNITALVSVQVSEWLKYYDNWVKANPQVRVSDIRGRRSKVLKYSLMLGIQWKNVKNIVREEFKSLKKLYSKTIIYGFTTSDERLKIEERYPEKQFTDEADFRKQLLANALARIGQETSIKLDEDMLNMHIEWVCAVLENESSRSIKYGDLTGQQLDTVKTHHEKFIDYMTLQVFGDRGYLFGIERENIANAIAVNNYPSLSDFQDFMYARAEAEAHEGEYGKEGVSKRTYSPSDVKLVKSLNQRFVDNQALTRYESYLNDNYIYDEEDKITGSAFGYKVPNSEILKKVEERISQATKDAWASLGPNPEPEYVISYINNEGNEEAENEGIDTSFVEPYVSAGYNKYLTDTYTLKPSETKSYTDAPEDTYITKEHKGTWKYNLKDNRYYKQPTYELPSPTYKKRTTTFERYHGSGDVASEFVPTYRTFSGHDMVVTVQVPITRNSNITKVIGAFQTITYSIHNDKSPVRVLGDMNVRRYVFGPRTVAGTLILTVFDRHWMKELLGTYKKIKGETERYFLMDELPAFNITISCANEYGHSAKLALYGVTIVNEGQVMSINDVYTENTYQFFATNVEYLDRVEKTSKTNPKKTATTNLPVKGQTQNTGSGASVSTPVSSTTSTTTPSTSSTETNDSINDEIKKRLDEYDPLRAQKEAELAQAIDDYIAGTKDKDGNLLYTKESIAKYIADWERSENYRRTALYKEKIMNPLLKELKANYEAGKIPEENYALQRKIVSGASSLLNTCVIVQANMAVADSERDRITAATGEAVPDVFPTAEETINAMKEKNGSSIRVVDINQTPTPGEYPEEITA